MDTKKNPVTIWLDYVLEIMTLFQVNYSYYPIKWGWANFICYEISATKKI